MEECDKDPRKRSSRRRSSSEGDRKRRWAGGRGRTSLRGPGAARAQSRNVSGASGESLHPLRGLVFALTLVGRVSPRVLAVMILGRLLSALMPAVGLWVQRDLLNLLGQIVAQRLLPRHGGLTGSAVPTAAVGSGGQALLVFLLLMLAINALSFTLGAASRAATGHLREWVGHDVAWRHHKVTTGVSLELLERAEFWDRAQRTWNGSVIVESLDGTLGFVSGLVLVAGILGVLLRVRWEIAPIVLLGALPSLVIGLRHSKQNLAFQRRTESRYRHASMLAQLLTDRASALEFRIFGSGKYLTGRWRALAEAQNGAALALVRMQIPANALDGLGRLLAFAASFTLIAVSLVHGRAGVGDMVVVVQALPRAQAALGGLLHGASTLGYSGGYAAETETFLRTKLVTETRGTQAFPRPLRNGIRVEGLCFTYPGNPTPTLRDVNMFIPEGETTALVGRNGAGKTTLVKLLLGLYRPTGGRILFDDVDLLDITPDSLHAQTTAAFQDFTRFALTLRENVGFGSLHELQDDAAIRNALFRVGLGDLPDRLPRGLDTMLSKAYDGGTELSGGQWQRVAMARALLRDAQVIALDEPTAALDPVSEVAMFRQFRQLAVGRTTILISHRLGIARLADHIAVLGAGRLLEYGSHAELMARNGEYATMFALQAAAYGSRTGDPPPTPTTLKGSNPVL